MALNKSNPAPQPGVATRAKSYAMAARPNSVSQGDSDHDVPIELPKVKAGRKLPASTKQPVGTSASSSKRGPPPGKGTQLSKPITRNTTPAPGAQSEKALSRITTPLREPAPTPSSSSRPQRTAAKAAVAALTSSAKKRNAVSTSKGNGKKGGLAASKDVPQLDAIEEIEEFVEVQQVPQSKRCKKPTTSKDDEIYVDNEEDGSDASQEHEEADTTFQPASVYNDLAAPSPEDSHRMDIDPHHRHVQRYNTAPPSSPLKRGRSPESLLPSKAPRLNLATRTPRRSQSVAASPTRPTIASASRQVNSTKSPQGKDSNRVPRSSPPPHAPVATKDIQAHAQPKSSSTSTVLTSSIFPTSYDDPYTFLNSLRVKGGRGSQRSAPTTSLPNVPKAQKQSSTSVPQNDKLVKTSTTAPHKSSAGATRAASPLSEIESFSTPPEKKPFKLVPFKSRNVVYAVDSDDDEDCRRSNRPKKVVKKVPKPLTNDVDPSSPEPITSFSDYSEDELGDNKRRRAPKGVASVKAPANPTAKGLPRRKGNAHREVVKDKSKGVTKKLSADQYSYWKAMGGDYADFAKLIKRGFWQVLCQNNWFPLGIEKSNLAEKGYGVAAKRWQEIKGSAATLPIPYTADTVVMCVTFLSEFRGAIKTNAKNLVKALYELYPPPNEDGSPIEEAYAAQFAKARVADLLKNNAFTINHKWQDHKGRPCSDVGTHPAVFELIRKSFYVPSILKDKYEFDAVCPLPIPCLALAIVALKAALLEWLSNGERQSLEFTEVHYQPVYQSFVSPLQEHAQLAAQRWKLLLQQHKDMCLALAPRRSTWPVAAQAFVVRPDSPDKAGATPIPPVHKPSNDASRKHDKGKKKANITEEQVQVDRDATN